MPNSNSDLLDLNVGLPLVDPRHIHHPRAKDYWNHESADRILFCRISMLGLLRLLTQPKVVAGQPFTPPEAWLAYCQFQALPEVGFLPESPGLETQMAAWSDSPTFPATLSPPPTAGSTDCYLAALAENNGSRLVSFDQDFQTFSGLNFLHLSI